MYDRSLVESELIKDASAGDVVQFEKNIKHRFFKVLRHKVGDKVALFDGRGSEAIAVLKENDSAEIISLNYEKEPLKMGLAQAWVSFEKCAQVVQRATELGVTDITFFVADHAQVKVNAKSGEKIEKLKRIAADAARQCGRFWVPNIEGPLLLSKAIGHCGDALLITGGLSSREKLSAYLVSCKATLSDPIWIFVGPEGDFSKSEFELLKKFGAKEVSWAPHVLRTETAGLVALSLILGARGLA